MKYICIFLTIVMLWGCMTFRYVGNGFSIAMIAFGLLAIALAFLGKRSLFRIHQDLGKAFVSLYGTLFIVSVLQYNTIKNITDSAYGSITLFLIILPLWMIVYVGQQYDIRKVILGVVYGNMYAFSLYGLWLYEKTGQDRLTSFYGSPPEVGMLLDLCIPFTIALGIYYWAWVRFRVISIILIVLELVAVVLTETRGSYLALSAGLVVVAGLYIWVQRDTLSWLKKIGAVIAICLFCVGAGSYTWYLGSSDMKRMEGGERLLMWESSYHMWEDHKLLGIGLSEWKEAYNNTASPYRPAEGKETTNVMPHNIYMYFGATGGLLSLAGLLGYMFFMSKYLLSKVKKMRNHPMAWAMLFMFVALMAHGLVDGTLISKHIGRIFYLLFGAGIIFTEMYPGSTAKK